MSIFIYELFGFFISRKNTVKSTYNKDEKDIRLMFSSVDFEV